MHRIWEVGVAGSPVIGRRRGAFSTLLRWPGLWASSDGVLATKSERKILGSTCLYSLYAWFVVVHSVYCGIQCDSLRKIGIPCNINCHACLLDKLSHLLFIDPGFYVKK